MPCPICESLHREHSQECETEARAIIKQQLTFSFGAMGTAIALDAGLDETILLSRKRRLKLATRMSEHKAGHHAA
jgi:plasmid stability protein